MTTAKIAAKERRRHVRAKRVLAIEHRLYKHRGVLVNGNWSYSTTENMSLAGILFLSEIHYIVSDILQVRVVMSGLDVFRGLGRVVRTDEKKSGMIAVAITFFDEKNRAR